MVHFPTTCDARLSGNSIWRSQFQFVYETLMFSIVDMTATQLYRFYLHFLGQATRFDQFVHYPMSVHVKFINGGH